MWVYYGSEIFRGGYLRSSNIDKLSLHVAYLDRINYRDSTDYQPMTVASPSRRFLATAKSDEFVFANGEYQLTSALSLKYYYANLEDIYKKNYADFECFLGLGNGKLNPDFHYYQTGESGSAKSSLVDNRNAGVMFTYAIGADNPGR